MERLLKMWIERAENEEDISIFDLIGTNCSYMTKWDLEKMLREVLYFFYKKKDVEKEKDFIEQLKEYREEWFEESED